MKNILAAFAVVMLLSACMQQGAGGNNSVFSKQNIGTVLGGAAGAAVGSNVGKGKGKIVGVAAGTLLGAMLGSSVGSSLDKMDMMYHDQTSQHALETAKSGTTLAWQNPDSGHSGTITPLSVSQNQTGGYCREYRQTIMVGGKAEEGYGRACRQPDGSWKVMN